VLSVKVLFLRKVVKRTIDVTRPKLPTAKVIVSPIFIRLLLWSFHTTRIGKTKITTSETIFGILPQIKKATWFIQVYSIAEFQFA